MSFDLLDRPLVFIPVKWPGLGQAEDGSAVPVENMIEVQIEILDRDEFNDWLKAGGADVGDAAERAAHELTTFKRVAKGWRKLKANGRVPGFEDENIARLLLFPGFVSAFGAAYIASWQGRVATREGNSEGSPGNGQAGEPTGETATDTTSKS